LVSISSSDTSAATTSDSRPPGGQNNPSGSEQLADTLSNILAQLMTINKRLELQSESIARHEQLLAGISGSAASKITTDKASSSGTASNGGGGGNSNSGDSFLALLCRCDGLTPEHKMNLFTGGMGEPMCSDVEMQ
jgi:hypothetical protein